MQTTSPRERRKRYLSRNISLKNQRSRWEQLWRDLDRFIYPQRAQFGLDSALDPEVDAGEMFNSTPQQALETMAAGLMAGVTPKSRPWFRLIPANPAISAESPWIRRHLFEVEETLRLVFNRSNFYEGAHAVYMDLGQYAVSALAMDSDPEDVLRTYHFPVGSYCFATSGRGVVDTLYRELVMTVQQIAQRFGLEGASFRVREAHERGHLDDTVRILHVIEPNPAYREGALGPIGKRWSSCWMELDAADDEAGILRESGYEEFPVLGPRWDTVGARVYGYGPGHKALKDSKSLQQVEKRLLQLSDKASAPPVSAPAAMMAKQVSLLAGSVTYVQGPQGAKVEPVFVPEPAMVQMLGLQTERHEARIKRGFHADLWISLIETEKGNMTATEVAERHDEKMMQLGPVMQRLEDEFLGPAIQRAYAIASRVPGLLPPLPEQLRGQAFRVEYISIVAQAQKLLGTASMERFVAYATQVAGVAPEILDVPDWDKQLRRYADAVGLEPDGLRDEAKVRAARKAKMQAQQQNEALAQAQAATQAAKTLSETEMGGDTALNRLTAAFGGSA